ncbi:hypothetical protein D3C76_1755680 [compost metagenome]
MSGELVKKNERPWFSINSSSISWRSGLPARLSLLSCPLCSIQATSRRLGRRSRRVASRLGRAAGVGALT